MKVQRRRQDLRLSTLLHAIEGKMLYSVLIADHRPWLWPMKEVYVMRNRRRRAGNDNRPYGEVPSSYAEISCEFAQLLDRQDALNLDASFIESLDPRPKSHRPMWERRSSGSSR